MALAETTDGRVAGHLADGLELVRQQQRPSAKTRGGVARLLGMARADDNDIPGSGGRGHAEPNGDVERGLLGLEGESVEPTLGVFHVEQNGHSPAVFHVRNIVADAEPCEHPLHPQRPPDR